MARPRISSLKALLAAVALSVSFATDAVTLFDVAPDALLKQSAEIQQKLNLSANQRMLWMQVEGKAGTILLDRQSRREQLLVEVGSRLTAPVELRDLAKKIAAEEDLSLQESRRIRELWLDIDDALDDSQRRIFHLAMLDQMNKIDPAADAGRAAAKPANGRDQAQGTRRTSRNLNGSMPRF